MKIAIYDIESTGAITEWSSIIEIGGVLIDENFNEIDRFNLRGRIPEGEIPQAKALLVNGTTIDQLTKSNLSNYMMLDQVERIFKKWSPAIFMGFSNINFDCEMIRKSFFRNLRYPYITNATPNKRHDALNIVRAAHAVDPKVLKTELNAKGNVSMKLESLSRLQGFDVSGAHTAQFDAINTFKILKLIKQKIKPNLWSSLLRTYSNEYKCIFVGDASMSPYEVVYPGGANEHYNEESGEVWLTRARDTWQKNLWINPLPEKYWKHTQSVQMIQTIFGSGNMVPMTLKGIEAGMQILSR